MKPIFNSNLAELTYSNNTAHKEKSLETLGQIAVADFRNILVLNKYKLDYSFWGKYTLKEACEEKNISTAQVEHDLNSISLQPRIYNLNYNDWAADYLADFITTNHHQYVRKFLLLLTEEFNHIAPAVQREYPFLARIGETFQHVATDMSAYLVEEEQVIFPYIRFLVQAKKSNFPSSLLPAGCMEHRLAMMEIEQKILGENIEFIRSSCNNYVLPEGNSAALALLYRWLNDFDNDLQHHAHLENNILFPKAIKLEKECVQRSTRLHATPNHTKFPKVAIDTLY